MIPALALIELNTFTPAIAVLDAIEKAATVRIVHVELNDLGGVIAKLTGSIGDLRSAVDAGLAVARAMGATVTSDILTAPAPQAEASWQAPPETSPLIEQPVVHDPQVHDPSPSPMENAMPDAAPFAIGLIETQGFTAVIEAIDTACKAANVEVLGREKLGGGYITVLLRGDVAAVSAAVEAGKARVEGLGKLIAAHVIPRPSAAVLALLPKV